MFEIDQEYEFNMIKGGDETRFWGKVERYEHPLLKLRDTTLDVNGVKTLLRGEIINVTSPNFISAVRKS